MEVVIRKKITSVKEYSDYVWNWIPESIIGISSRTEKGYYYESVISNCYKNKISTLHCALYIVDKEKVHNPELSADLNISHFDFDKFIIHITTFVDKKTGKFCTLNIVYADNEFVLIRTIDTITLNGKTRKKSILLHKSDLCKEYDVKFY